MRILIYGLNFSPELTGTGKYSGEMAVWLAARRHEVRVLTAPPYYPEWKVAAGFQGGRYVTERAQDLTIYRCPIYVPGTPSTVKRVLHLISFSLSSLPNLLRQWAWRPNVIMVVVPTLFCAPQAALLARFSGALSIIHIQDLEVDALFGLGLLRSGFLQRFAESFERFILRRFDRISTISSGMLARVQAKGVAEDRLRFLPNWSNVERFREAKRSPALLEYLGIDPAKRVVLYSGNLGEKQGLEIIVDCARCYQYKEDIVFLIVGSGAGKSRLLDLVRASGLRNVAFAPLQPLEDLPALLASADCHLVVQRRGAADSVMPSKLTNILAVGGNAVITADPDTSLGELCLEFPGIATLVPPESADDLAHGVGIALALPRINSIALDYAEQYLSKDRVLRLFFDEVTADVEAREKAH